MPPSLQEEQNIGEPLARDVVPNDKPLVSLFGDAGARTHLGENNQSVADNPFASLLVDIRARRRDLGENNRSVTDNPFASLLEDIGARRQELGDSSLAHSSDKNSFDSQQTQALHIARQEYREEAQELLDHDIKDTVDTTVPQTISEIADDSRDSDTNDSSIGERESVSRYESVPNSFQDGQLQEPEQDRATTSLEERQQLQDQQNQINFEATVSQRKDPRSIPVEDNHKSDNDDDSTDETEQSLMQERQQNLQLAMQIQKLQQQQNHMMDSIQNLQKLQEIQEQQNQMWNFFQERLKLQPQQEFLWNISEERLQHLQLDMMNCFQERLQLQSQRDQNWDSFQERLQLLHRAMLTSIQGRGEFLESVRVNTAIKTNNDPTPKPKSTKKVTPTKKTTSTKKKRYKKKTPAMTSNIGRDEVTKLNTFLSTLSNPSGAIPSKVVALLKDLIDRNFPVQQQQQQQQNKNRGLLLGDLDCAYLDSLEDIELRVNYVKDKAKTLISSICSKIGVNADLLNTNDDPLESLILGISARRPGLDEEGANQYNINTLDVSMKMNVILQLKQLLVGLIRGTMVAHERENGRIAIWGPFPRSFWKFYRQEAKLVTVHGDYFYLVDLVSGDTISCKNGRAFQVLKFTPKMDKNRKIESTSDCKIMSTTGRHQNMLKHRMILHALDPNYDLFGLTQRFYAFRGYYKKKTRLHRWHSFFDSSGTDFFERQDEDGNDLSPVYKKECDHMLGYLYNTCLALQWTSRQVNQLLHFIRMVAGHWGHPFYHQIYTDEVTTRQCPEYVKDLPPTLEQGIDTTIIFDFEGDNAI